MAGLSKFVLDELVRHGWKAYQGGHPLPKDSFVRDGVLLSLSLLKSNGMYHVSIQSMSKVDVRLVSVNEVLTVIENGKWSE
jgi:hypothetical protein